MLLLPSILESPERKLLVDTSAEYLDSMLPPDHVSRLDDASEFPRHVWEGLGDLGLLGIGIPEQLGGSGGSAADSLMVIIEIARRFPSLAVDYVLCGMVGRTLLNHGGREQQEWLRDFSSGSAIFAYAISEADAGTDVLALRTRAEETPKGWSVTGQKMWTSLAAEASLILTLLRTDPPDPPDRRNRGLSLIAVPADQEGVQITPIRLAGMRAAGTCEVSFDGAVAPSANLIGPRGRGFHMLREVLDLERILSAGISLGIGTAALDLAVHYAGDRTAFGRPIGAYQAIQHSLADSATAVSGAMLLTERAVMARESGKETTVLAAMAKLAAAEAAESITDAGMRTMAAAGLARESPMQMLFRDARLQLFSPISNEMVRNILGEALGLPRSY